MIEEICFPWESRHYFSEALRKGTKWVFDLEKSKGVEGDYCVLSVFNMQNKTYPEDCYVRVLFYPLLDVKNVACNSTKMNGPR